VPNELAAGQTVTLPYRITAIQDLPTAGLAPAKQSLQDWLENKPEPAAQDEDKRAKMSGCGLFSVSLRLNYLFVCPAGDERRGTAGAQFVRAVGGSCSANNPPTPIGPRDGGGWGGGFGGGSGGGAPLDRCGPDCAEGCACSSGCGPPSDPPPFDPTDDGPPPPPCSGGTCCNQ
ncbi:MAG: hypothetical protein KDI56_17265, partial [Xanthomonadales bacterium]|nr:hypothetical protein [Xanthomonadales bacterium]